jgi:hypothetical protein
MFIICFASSSDFYLSHIKQKKSQPFEIGHCPFATGTKRPILAVIGRETPMFILIFILNEKLG